MTGRRALAGGYVGLYTALGLQRALSRARATQGTGVTPATGAKPGCREPPLLIACSVVTRTEILPHGNPTLARRPWEVKAHAGRSRARAPWTPGRRSTADCGDRAGAASV